MTPAQHLAWAKRYRERARISYLHCWYAAANKWVAKAQMHEDAARGSEK